MERGWSVRPERVEMERGPIAFVLVKPIRGKEPVVEAHERIASHLGDDRSAGDGVTELVTSHDGPARDGQRRDVSSVNEDELWLAGKVFHSLGHRLQGRSSDVLGIDDTGWHDTKTHEGVRGDGAICHEPLAAGEALGVVDANPKRPAA